MEHILGATVDLRLIFDRAIPSNQLSSADFTFTGGATFNSISPTTGSNTTFTITVNNPSNNSGSYTATLRANAVAAKDNDYLAGPVTAETSGAVTFNTRTLVIPTITWGTPDGSLGRLRIPLNINGAGVRGISGPDFEIINAAGTPITNQSDWSILPQFDRVAAGDSVIITARPSINVNAAFGIRLKANTLIHADSSTTTVPSTNIDSRTTTVESTIAARNIPVTGMWRGVRSVDNVVIEGNITFSGVGGSTTVYGIESSDFEVLKETSPGSNTYAPESNWDIRVSIDPITTGTPLSVIALAPSNVTSGMYKLRLKVNSIRAGQLVSNPTLSPAINTDSAAVSISAIRDLDDRQNWTLTLILPDKEEGSLQISVDEDEFHLTSDMSREGPETKQYLGTVYYNTGAEEVVTDSDDVQPPPVTPTADLPYIEDTPDWAGVFIAGKTDIYVNFNETVRNVNTCAFEIDPDGVTLANTDIWYSSITADIASPNKRPADNTYTQNQSDSTITGSYRYYRLRVTANPVPPGIITVKLKSGSGITNDPIM